MCAGVLIASTDEEKCHWISPRSSSECSERMTEAQWKLMQGRKNNFPSAFLSLSQDCCDKRLIKMSLLICVPHEYMQDAQEMN